MSKIHKALTSIAAKRKRADTAADRAERYLKRFGPNLPAGRTTTDSSGLEDIPPIPTDMIGGEVCVDVDRLERDGLWQKDDAAEVLREQFRRAKRPVIANAFSSEDSRGDFSNICMIASAMPGAGKSFCAMNLARSISRERDIGVMVVDGDVLKASLTRSMNMTDRPGMLDFLLDEKIGVQDIVVQTDLADILFVPAGQRQHDSAELLASRRMRSLMLALSRAFAGCVIIVDTPPMLVTNEAHVISSYAGQVVFVVEARRSSRENVLQALASLDHEKPINAILNKLPGAPISGASAEDYGYYPFAPEQGG